MTGTALAASHAIQIARLRSLREIGPDEILLGCLMALARFGVSEIGPWTFDLESFGVDWLGSPSKPEGAKVAYSETAVGVFDRAARIARADGSAEVRIEHFLVAFANEENGLMGELKRTHGIDAVSWRAAAARIGVCTPASTGSTKGADAAVNSAVRDYLTPEEAAEALGIHVQPLRAYVRSGKLPALRIAGERSLRIRRSDLDKVLEPLVPDVPDKP